MKLISEILKCTAKKGNISNLARGGFSENFIKKFNFRRPSIIPLVVADFGDNRIKMTFIQIFEKILLLKAIFKNP